MLVFTSRQTVEMFPSNDKLSRDRDALSDLALHFLNKMKIMVVKDIEREDIEFICKVCFLSSSPPLDRHNERI